MNTAREMHHYLPYKQRCWPHQCICLNPLLHTESQMVPNRPCTSACFTAAFSTITDHPITFVMQLPMTSDEDTSLSSLNDPPSQLSTKMTPSPSHRPHLTTHLYYLGWRHNTAYHRANMGLSTIDRGTEGERSFGTTLISRPSLPQQQWFGH